MPVSRGETPPTTIPQAPPRSAWLGFLPVSALEDNLRNVHLDAEEAQEVDEEEGELLFTFDDLPLVFNCPRHWQSDQAVDMSMQVRQLVVKMMVRRWLM